MPSIDLAKRAFDHSFRLDPIVRSLLDTDFYKLLMLQMIWRRHRDVPVRFSVINRTKSVRLVDEVDEGELRAQLDHCRTLRFTNKELIWLGGNSFYGTTQIFSPEFLAWLGQYQLPDYELARGEDGQFRLEFSGGWADVTLWEIPALSILNELRSRRAMARLGRFELDILYARAKTKLWGKVERLRSLEHLKISDFGTRRRHGFLWQNWCVEALKEGLGGAFIGTSNVLLAMNNDLEAVGTNGHELPMVLAALAGEDDAALRAVPYQVLEEWQADYSGNLRIALPDAFGTKAFLADAPEWLADWKGFRPDSAPPIEGGEDILNWWQSKGRDPKDRLLIFADGMDVDTIEQTHAHFKGRVKTSYGWGTNLTNDFRDCAPQTMSELTPISLVCKVVEAGGRPAVKLSDNVAKATGDAAEVARYVRVFGEAGRDKRSVTV